MLAFYIAFDIGLRVDVNYCGSRVSSVDLLVWQADSCCGMEREAECCSTESLVFKTTQEQSTSPSLDIQPVPDLFLGWAIEQVDEEVVPAFVAHVPKIPPDPEGPPIYLKYSRLVFYG